MTVCPECKGSGIIELVPDTLFPYGHSYDVCDVCDGEGVVE